MRSMPFFIASCSLVVFVALGSACSGPGETGTGGGGGGGSGGGGAGTTSSSSSTSSSGGSYQGPSLPDPPGIGTGATIYVATTGDDANDGLSLDTPVRTLEHATELVQPGSEVLVRAGTYEGFMVSDGELGTPSAWIRMRPYEDEAVTIQGAGSGPAVYFYASSCDESNNLVNGDCDKAYWRLEGLRIQGSPDGGGDGNVIKVDTPQVQIVGNKLCYAVVDIIKGVRTADDLSIVGNEIWQDPGVVVPGSNAQGIDVTGADRLLVAANYLHDLTDIAMYAKGNARNSVFENNIVTNTGTSGEGNAIMCGQQTDASRLVDGDYESYDCTVRNNVVSQVGGACVAVGSSERARVYNNTCFDTARDIHAALFLTNESEVGQASTDVEFRGNIVYQTTSDRIFTDSDELAMTDWSTLVLRDNVYFASGGSPVFNLKSTSIADGAGFAEFTAELSALTGSGDESTVADPLFADTTSFDLQASSPAVNAMECLVSADQSGVSRPQGPACDVGARERVQ